LKDITRLEKKRQDLKDRIDRNSPEDYSNEEKDSLKREWKELMDESEQVMERLDE
jgi:ABC-type phosphate transport system auxiliary subunit